MADATKAWHAVFDKGSKQAQERLKKAHGHKPEFQAFLKSRGAEGGERSVKQATTSLKKATGAKVAAQKIADMRYKKALQASSDRVREMGRRRRESGEGLGGGLETARDVVAHVKKYGSIKAGRLGEETMNEVTKKEAEAALGGPTKLKPKGPAGKLPLGFRMARSAARKAMKGQIDAVHKSMEKTMKKEEVEQIIEQDDTMEKKEMAQTQLHFIGYAAKEILEFIDMGGEIEEWYQNKLSKVQSEVESLHSYIEGEKRRTGMVKEEEQIDEKAPPGAKYERMVKHIKKGYAKGGLTPKEKSIAYATAWKAYGKKEEVEETAEPIDEKYMGFKKVMAAAKAGGARNPVAVAAAIGRKKYGKEKFQAMAAAGKRKANEEVETVEEGSKDWKKAFSAVAQKNLQKDVGKMRSKVGRLNYIGMQPKVDERPKVTATVTKKGAYSEEVVAEAEGKVAVTPKEKALAAHHGDPKKITYGDVIKARLKSAAAKKMGK